MAKRDYDFLGKKIQKQTFGILSTISHRGWSQSSGVLYGSEFNGNQLKIFIITDKNYIKSKNISNNNHVSFVIPFPHYWLRFVPSFTIYFQGLAKIRPYNYQKGLASYKRKKILKMELKELEGEASNSDYVFIEVNPFKKLHSYGVGFSFLDSIKNPHKLAYSVIIPNKENNIGRNDEIIS